VLLVLLGAIACQRDAARQIEAARLARLVEVLREADNTAKGAPLEALEAAPCSAPPVCEMKATCVRGYRQYVDAYEELRRARSRLDAAKPPDLAAIEARLASAQLDIKSCTSAEGAVRRAYHL
jgi:hypothetical protein